MNKLSRKQGKHDLQSGLKENMFGQSAPLPEREVSTRLGSNVVDLLDPNGEKLLEREVGFL